MQGLDVVEYDGWGGDVKWFYAHGMSTDYFDGRHYEVEITGTGTGEFAGDAELQPGVINEALMDEGAAEGEGNEGLGDYNWEDEPEEVAPRPLDVTVRMREGVVGDMIGLDPVVIENFKNVYSMEFDDYSAFVRKAEQMPSKELGELSSRAKSTSFHSDVTFEQAVQMGLNGWPEGTQQVYKRLEVIHDRLRLKTTKPELHYSMTGPGTIDFSRLMQGHPLPYVTWQEGDDVKHGKGKVVKVVFNIAASAGVSTEAMVHKGVLGCALVDVLERFGYRVEVKWVDVSAKMDKAIVVGVMLKKAGDVLDIDRMVFALGHPASLRRLGFSVMEHAPVDWRRAVGIVSGGGYGCVGNVKNTDAIVFNGNGLQGGSSVEGQLGWLRKQLKKQGIELED